MVCGYEYKSKIARMSIRPGENGKWALWIEDCIYGPYHSPEAAADDVYMQATGHYEWDTQNEITEPCDLSEWTRINLQRPPW